MHVAMQCRAVTFKDSEDVMEVLNSWNVATWDSPMSQSRLHQNLGFHDTSGGGLYMAPAPGVHGCKQRLLLMTVFRATDFCK